MIVYRAKFAIIRILSCLSFQRLIANNPIRCRNQMEQQGYLQEIWLGQLTNTKISHLLNVCTMGVNGVSWWHHKWQSCKMHLSTEITCEICKNSLTWMMSSLSQETLIFPFPNTIWREYYLLAGGQKCFHPSGGPHMLHEGFTINRREIYEHAIIQPSRQYHGIWHDEDRLWVKRAYKLPARS